MRLLDELRNLRRAHEVEATLDRTYRDNSFSIWACGDCSLRFYPACPTCVDVGHRNVVHPPSSPETTPDACLDVERLAKALENAPIWDPDDGGMLGPIETIAAEVAAQYAVIVGGKPCRRRAGDGEECGEAYGHAGPHHPRARVHAADDACPNCGLPLTTHKDFGCPDEIAFCAFPTMDGPCGSLAGHESVHMGSGPSS